MLEHALQQRQRERGGLAGAGLGRAHHVAAGQHDRNRLAPGSASSSRSPGRPRRAAAWGRAGGCRSGRGRERLRRRLRRAGVGLYERRIIGCSSKAGAAPIELRARAAVLVAVARGTLPLHDSRHRRRWLHRRRISSSTWLATTGEPVLNLDALTYAGNLANLGFVARRSRHHLCARRHRRPGPGRRNCWPEHQPRGSGALCRREPCRPLDSRAGRLHSHKRQGQLHLAGGGSWVVDGLPGEARGFRSYMYHRRGLRQARPDAPPLPREPHEPNSPYFVPARRPATIWCERGTTLTGCRC